MKPHLTNRNVAIFCAATFLPFAIATGTLVGGFLKFANPSNIDVWQPLAYLSPILVSAFFISGLLFVAALVAIFHIRAQEKTFNGSARLPLVLLAVNCLLIGCILFGQHLTKTAEDNWARANNQPTHEQRDRQLDQFFKNLE